MSEVKPYEVESYKVKAYNVKPYTDEEIDKLSRGEKVPTAEEMEVMESKLKTKPK